MAAKKEKKMLLGAVAGFLLIGVLAGCGDNGNGGGSGDGGSNGGSGKKVTLRMIESLTSPARTTVLQEMIDKFETANPNIKVELISPPFDQADNKIKTMLGAKEDLDVLEVRDLTISEFSNNGYLEPLNDYAERMGGLRDRSRRSQVGRHRSGDKLYFVRTACTSVRCSIARIGSKRRAFSRRPTTKRWWRPRSS